MDNTYMINDNPIRNLLYLSIRFTITLFSLFQVFLNIGKRSVPYGEATTMIEPLFLADGHRLVANHHALLNGLQAQTVTILPYLGMDGCHSTIDIPRQLDAAVDRLANGDDAVGISP